MSFKPVTELILSAWFICVPYLWYEFSILISDGQCGSVVYVCRDIVMPFHKYIHILNAVIAASKGQRWLARYTKNGFLREKMRFLCQNSGQVPIRADS